ncbi:MAG: hypothetical protein IJY27_01840 [Clostridia bacterium]|nr:hypothetical protein [Clostridia bacterium]
MDKNTSKKPAFKDKRFLYLALLAVAGLVLMLLGGRGGNSTTGQSVTVEHDTAGELEEYTAALRRDIAALCEQVGGVSDVTVAVSLECGFEYVYATDQSSDVNASGSETQIKYITVGSGSSETTVYITEKLPRIGGIGVVCRGGNDAAVVRRLTSLLSAAYNIGSNKIYITGT